MSKRYRFSITIIEEDETMCTRIYKKVTTNKMAYIESHLEALHVYKDRPKTESPDDQNTRMIQNNLL